VSQEGRAEEQEARARGSPALVLQEHASATFTARHEALTWPCTPCLVSFKVGKCPGEVSNVDEGVVDQCNGRDLGRMGDELSWLARSRGKKKEEEESGGRKRRKKAEEGSVPCVTMLP